MENKEIYGHIYKITNIINQKCYIGQTTQNPPEKRFYTHKRTAKYGSQYYLHNAIRNHGEQNFTFEIIDIAYNQKELNLLEGVYIKLFKSMYNENGYNLIKIINGIGKHSKETKEKIKITRNKPENLLQSSNLGKLTRGKSIPNTSSKYCGVSVHKNRWVSKITFCKKPHLIGNFCSEIDAAKAYDIKAIELFGSDCVLNFPELLPQYLNNEIKIEKCIKNKSNSIQGVHYSNTRKRWIAKTKVFKSKTFKTQQEAEQQVLEWQSL